MFQCEQSLKRKFFNFYLPMFLGILKNKIDSVQFHCFQAMKIVQFNLINLAFMTHSLQRILTLPGESIKTVPVCNANTPATTR